MGLASSWVAVAEPSEWGLDQGYIVLRVLFSKDAPSQFVKHFL